MGEWLSLPLRLRLLQRGRQRTCTEKMRQASRRREKSSRGRHCGTIIEYIRRVGTDADRGSVRASKSVPGHEIVEAVA